MSLQSSTAQESTIRCAHVATRFCQTAAAYRSMGMLNSARQKRLGKLTTASSTSIISTEIIATKLYHLCYLIQIMDSFKRKIAQRRQKDGRNSDRYEGLLLKPLYENISRDFEDNLGDNIYRIITEEIPNSLINSQIIKNKQEFQSEQYLQFAVTELHYQLDKFDDEIQNIEGTPDQILEIQRLLAETERKNKQLVKSTLEAAQALTLEARELALQRLVAKHQEEVLDFQLKIKQYPQTSIPYDKVTEVNSKFQNALRELEERNKRQKGMFSDFLKEKPNC